MNKLFVCFAGKKKTTLDEDTCQWHDAKVMFGARAMQKQLERDRMTLEQTLCDNFPAKRIWVQSVPLKVPVAING